MEVKKTSGADLENERTTFFLLGFVVVLSTFFVVMEWGSSEPEFSDWESLSPVFIEEEFGVEIESPAPSVVVEERVEAVLPEIVYEDFNVVEDPEIIEEELTSPDQPLVEQVEEKADTPLPETVEEETDAEVYTEVEVMPQFQGGMASLARFIYENVQYPSVALKQRIEGRVWCSFIINEDGSVSDVQLEQGVYIFLDEEAVRVLKSMPNWKPGLREGKPVRVKIYLPIVFKR